MQLDIYESIYPSPIYAIFLKKIPFRRFYDLVLIDFSSTLFFADAILHVLQDIIVYRSPLEHSIE